MFLEYCNNSILMTGEEYSSGFTVYRSNYEMLDQFELMEFLKPECYLIEGVSEEVLKNNVKFLSQQNNLDARGKFMFITTRFSNTFTDFLTSEFIFNAIFLESSTGRILTYHPFEEYTDFSEMGICGREGITNFTNEVITTKLPKSWENSTLKVMYSTILVYAMCHECDHRGLEIDIFSTIADHFKINIEFYEIGNYTEQILLFLDKKRSVYFGGQLIRDQLEYTYPYYTDALAWYVPSPKQLPRWRFLFTIFSFDVWLAWGTIIAIFTFFWIFGNFLLNKKLSLRTVLLVPNIIFFWFLEQMYNVQTKSSYHLVLKVYLLFTAIMMNFLFRSRCTYILNGINFEKGIDRVEDIISGGLVIGCTDFVAKIIGERKDIAEYLEDNFVNCRAIECLSRTAFDNDLASVSLIGVARFSSGFFLDSKGRSLLKQLKSPTYVTRLVAFFNRGHPMFPWFDRKLQYLVEAGIVGKIASKYDEYYFYKEVNLSSTKMLGLQHIMAPSAIWSIGMVLSILVYIWELKNTPKRER